jgi:large subunit ribosomal protein L14
MVYASSKVQIVDNSGVRLVRCIKVLGKSNPRALGRVGNLIVCSVLRALPRRKIKVHDICRCIIIRQRRKVQRLNGMTVSFYKSAAVVVDARRQPIANRIKGSTMSELRKRRHMKIISLASSLI